MKTFLAIDVGNTSTSLGLIPLKKPPTIIKRFVISTQRLKTRSAENKLRRFIPPKEKESIGGILISSVVPEMNRHIVKLLKNRGLPRPHFMSNRWPSPIKNRTKRPQDVGADRLVNSRAAWEYFKGPSIVIDFGTATTFDCTSARGEYLGGVISAGPRISSQALFEQAAKLPHVTLHSPSRILGQTTLESIKAGLYHGYRGSIMEISRQLKKRMGPRTRVFVTGGEAAWVLNGLPLKAKIDPNLTLKGLFFLWFDHEKN